MDDMAKQSLIDMVRGYGAAETAFEAAKADNVSNPPKLQAAYAMMMACEAGDATHKDANDLTKAYFEGKGGKMPSSLAQQQSKFAAFMKCGDKNIGAQTWTAVHTQLNGMNDAKDQKRARSGIVEKMVKVMVAANEASAVPDYAAIRGVLLPDADVSDEVVKHLEAAMAALSKAEKASDAVLVTQISSLIKSTDALVKRRAEASRVKGEDAREDMVKMPEPTVGAAPVRTGELPMAEYLDVLKNEAEENFKACVKEAELPTIADALIEGSNLFH